MPPGQLRWGLASSFGSTPEHRPELWARGTSNRARVRGRLSRFCYLHCVIGAGDARRARAVVSTFCSTSWGLGLVALRISEERALLVSESGSDSAWDLNSSHFMLARPRTGRQVQ